MALVSPTPDYTYDPQHDPAPVAARLYVLTRATSRQDAVMLLAMLGLPPIDTYEHVEGGWVA